MMKKMTNFWIMNVYGLLLKLLLLLSELSIVLTVVEAFSSGMGGSCDSGMGSIESNRTDNTHILYNGYNRTTTTTTIDNTNISLSSSLYMIDTNRTGTCTSLSDSGMIVQLNGKPILPSNVTITNITVPVNEEVIWDVMMRFTVLNTTTTLPSHYKGIFVRVEKMTDDFLHRPMDNSTLKNVISCDPMFGVIGVNHNSNIPKTWSSGNMYFTSTGPVTMDISIVFVNNVSTSYYAFDRFTFTVVDSNDDDTTIITSPPSTSPISEIIERPPSCWDGFNHAHDDGINRTSGSRSGIRKRFDDTTNTITINQTVRTNGNWTKDNYVALNRSCDDVYGRDRFSGSGGNNRDGQRGGNH